MSIIAIDFDGTIVTHDYPALGKPVPMAIETIKELQANGHYIMLWTMRSGKELEQAVDYLYKNNIILWGINENPEQHWSSSNKQYAHLYIDDAAVGCPLVLPDLEALHHESRPYVDWERVRKVLKKLRLIGW